MQKKGISPLIATVLLIGSTIALAALVMVWAQDLFRDITKDENIRTQLLLKCNTEVKVSIPTQVKCVDPQLEVVIDNQNEADIHGFIFRVFKGEDEVQSIEQDSNNFPNYPLNAFTRNKYLVDVQDGTMGVTKLEIIPKIKMDNGEIKTCAQNKEVTISFDSSTCLP